ncbi:hypothetical protein CA260_02295 [Dyella jiangningensis]|uniref:Uncharacterized protein n=1 Tax=Dyella jiangningensis TaxID=1379159 RepID=A0A328P3G1_9GAMM|nr:hypothetical protein CA260_02295 [Dyella jiangningensis]
MARDDFLADGTKMPGGSRAGLAQSSRLYRHKDRIATFILPQDQRGNLRKRAYHRVSKGFLNEIVLAIRGFAD